MVETASITSLGNSN